MSQLRVTTLNNASNTGTANITLDDAGNATVGNTLVMGSSFKRNKIINGDMRVDQRATAVTASSYTVDRWQFAKSNDATESVAQNSDAPTGFSYSLRNTVSIADTSIGASQYSLFFQTIEGYNVADLGFGTANAKTVTLSFWVKATQTGTYSAVLQGGATTRRAFKAFTVSASNTWEFKTLTFSGDTNTGSTWNSTNGAGLDIQFYFALGSNFLNGTDGVWAAGSTNNYGPSGMSNALSANGNIYAVTGVQLEVGSVATPYERQIYSEQFSQCARYCQVMTYSAGYLPGGGLAILTANIRGYFVNLQTQMRANPTITLPAAGSGSGQICFTTSSGANPSTIGTHTVARPNPYSFQIEADGYTSAFTAGNMSLLNANTTSVSIKAEAEL